MPARSGAAAPTACGPAGGAAAACAPTGTRAPPPPGAARAGAALPGLQDSGLKRTQGGEAAEGRGEGR